MFCSQCEFELPENAKFCTNCGLRQMDAVNVAVSQPQKDQPISKLDREQTQLAPHIADNSGNLLTTKAGIVCPASTTPPIGNETTVPYTPVPPLLKARFVQNTGPLYIGRVVSITRKPLRRNLLLTRTGLYITLIILTCIFIRVGFAILYAVLHHQG
jgi:hypothetical protein